MRFPFLLASSFFVSSIHSKDVAKTRGEHKALKALWMDRKLEATIFFFFVCVVRWQNPKLYVVVFLISKKKRR